MLKSRGHNPIRHCSSLGSAVGKSAREENPKCTQSQLQHQPARTGLWRQMCLYWTDVALLAGGEGAAQENQPQHRHCLMSSPATATSALLQVPTSAQAEDALFSTIISPLSSLNFCWVVCSFQLMDCKCGICLQKVVSHRKERQNFSLISDLFNIPLHMTGTREGVGGLILSLAI